MRIIHAYDYLDETHSLVRYQQILIKSLEQRVIDMKLRLLVFEIGAATMEIMIGCLQHQLS